MEAEDETGQKYSKDVRTIEAAATLISQLANFLIMLVLFLQFRGVLQKSEEKDTLKTTFDWKQYAAMLLPMLICEFMWNLGENVYAAIYGHLGTDACAAMTLINPIQGLMIGALCGLSQAAGLSEAAEKPNM